VSDEQQIAALREEIQRAGDTTDRLRFGLAIFLLLSMLFMLGFAAYGPLWLLVSVSSIVLVPFLVAWPVASAYRAGCERRLYCTVAQLSVEERANLLVPLLQNQCRDTRRVVASLARDFGLPTELTPAAAPDARGDEATPAEPSHGSRLDN
jgi:hypothetical protein